MKSFNLIWGLILFLLSAYINYIYGMQDQEGSFCVAKTFRYDYKSQSLVPSTYATFRGFKDKKNFFRNLVFSVTRGSWLIRQKIELLDLSHRKELKELPCLSRLKELKELDLSYSGITDSTLSTAIKNGYIPESIEALNCSFCAGLVETPNVRKLKNLKYLSLYGCKNLYLSELKTYFFKNLWVLDVRNTTLSTTFRQLGGNKKLLDEAADMTNYSSEHVNELLYAIDYEIGDL
jgi:hypothetical protein